MFALYHAVTLFPYNLICSETAVTLKCGHARLGLRASFQRERGCEARSRAGSDPAGGGSWPCSSLCSQALSLHSFIWRNYAWSPAPVCSLLPFSGKHPSKPRGREQQGRGPVCTAEKDGTVPLPTQGSSDPSDTKRPPPAAPRRAGWERSLLFLP